MEGMGGAFNMARQGLVNDDFAIDDGFLDNYLTQLHSSTSNPNRQNLAAMQQQAQQRNALGTGSIPQSILASQAALMGQMGGMPNGAMGGNQPGPGMQGMPGFAPFGMQAQMQGFPMQPGMMGQMPAGFGLGQPMGMEGMQFGSTPAAAGAAAAGDAQQATGTRRGRRKAKPKDDSPLEDNSGDDSDSDSSADGQKTRKKREVSKAFTGGADMTAAERKHLALQEKNRRAQRRFRERQKAKLQDLHKQIDELTHKVMSLQTENSSLHSRTSILEKVLDMRNEQIQVMQETREAVVAGTPLPNVDTSPMTLTVANGQAIQLTYDMLRDLTPEQIYKIYQTYIKELSVKVVDYSKAEQQDAELAEQIEKLTREVVILLMRLSLLRPIEMRKFVAVSRQYHANEAEAFSMWRTVVQSMKMSDQQQQEAVQLKNMFMAKIEPIMEERRRLNVQIQANLPQDSFHTKNAITYIKTHEAVAKLRDNLRLEHNVVLDFCAALFQGVLRPHQMGYLLVQAYPVVPDALAVASAVGSTMDVASPAQSGGPNASGSNLLSFGAAGFGASFMGGFIPGNMLGAPIGRTSSADSKQDTSSPSALEAAAAAATPAAAAATPAAAAAAAAAAAPLQPVAPAAPLAPAALGEQSSSALDALAGTARVGSATGSIGGPMPAPAPAAMPAAVPAPAAPAASGIELLLGGSSGMAAAAAAATASASAGSTDRPGVKLETLLGQQNAGAAGAAPAAPAAAGAAAGFSSLPAGLMPTGLLGQANRGMVPSSGFPTVNSFSAMGFGAGSGAQQLLGAGMVPAPASAPMGMAQMPGLGSGLPGALAGDGAADGRYPSFSDLAKKAQGGPEQGVVGAGGMAGGYGGVNWGA